MACLHRMKIQSYDLIGDIHGHQDKLERLLVKLGYHTHAAAYRHPLGRKAIFLGDYVDRGPAVREVLHTVRGMVEAGDALAIMGNHELGAIQGHTPNRLGGTLKPEWPATSKGHQATLRAFEGRAKEWADWIAWMKRLPIYLELDGLRAVHACWDGVCIASLRKLNASLEDKDFLHRCSTSGTPEHKMVETVLKGPEIDVPPGCCFLDPEGFKRQRVRTRWWDIPTQARAGELAMPVPLPGEGDVPENLLRHLPNYGVTEKPVFVGHYWLSPNGAKAPLTPNIACLDYSAAKGDYPLVAYRWDGEKVLDAAKYVTGTPEVCAATQAR